MLILQPQKQKKMTQTKLEIELIQLLEEMSPNVWISRLIENTDTDFLKEHLPTFYISHLEEKVEKLEKVEEEKVEEEFLKTYLVPNYYLKEDLCEDYTDARWEDFKTYIKDYNADGGMDDIMNELKLEFELRWAENTFIELNFTNFNLQS